jgi:hypothetical protein
MPHQSLEVPSHVLTRGCGPVAAGGSPENALLQSFSGTSLLAANGNGRQWLITDSGIQILIRLIRLEKGWLKT